MRALTIAQDSSLRAKRRAAGRSVAAAAADKGTKVNQELLFLRTLDDLDAPHFRLLLLMASAPPHPASWGPPRSGVPQGWTPSSIVAQDSGLSDTVRMLLTGLERHGLVRGPAVAGITLNDKNGEGRYLITDYGRHFLERLAEPPAAGEATATAAEMEP
jgi:hypothetical protein